MIPTQTPSLLKRIIWWILTTGIVALGTSWLFQNGIVVGIIAFFPLFAILNWGALVRDYSRHGVIFWAIGNVGAVCTAIAYGAVDIWARGGFGNEDVMSAIAMIIVPILSIISLGIFTIVNLFKDRILSKF